MNIMTCGALLCLHVDSISEDKRIVFGACLLLSGLGEQRCRLPRSLSHYTAGIFLCQRFIEAFRDHDGGKKGGAAGEDDAKSGKEQ